MNQKHPITILLQEQGWEKMREWFDTPFDEIHAEEVSEVLGEVIHDDTMDVWQEYYYRLHGMYSVFRHYQDLSQTMSTYFAIGAFNLWYYKHR